ncbi:MAG: GTPase Era [Chromatiaceae bacterium]
MTYRSGYAVLFGRPNVGKSTLLNRLLGQKLAITSHKPQTTRHRILGICSLEAGQAVFVDTPGLHARGGRAMNRYLNRAATTALHDVDVVLFVVEAGNWTDEDAAVLRALGDVGRPVIAVVNKVDQVTPKEQLLPFLSDLAARHAFSAVVPVSARTGDNTDTLLDQVLQRLPEGSAIFPQDQLSDRSERFFAAELLREQLIRRYHRELPYALTVEIEKFEASSGRYAISAVIWVERENQRAILLGKGGEAIKQAASAARQSMIDFFQTRVHLDVWIKVKKNWSSEEATLVQLGYTD